MPTRTRRPTAERRTEIAEAALRIIGERGLTSLTTATLAAEVGVTSGALFRHFTSRDAILAESVRCAVERIEATFPDPALAPPERVLELARSRVRLLGSDPGLAWLLRSDQAYLTMPESAVTQLRDLVVRTRKYLFDAIRQGAADGTIRNDIEPEVLVLTVMGTIHALIGLTGLHRQATSARRPDTERVLSGLARLVAPPAATAPSRQVHKTRGRTRRKQ
jgi:AcrR family transcriptional regulator